MKKNLLSQTILAGITMVLLCSNFSFGQQVIGEFSVMDGGFEGQILGPVTSSAVSSVNWTATNTGLAGSTGSGIKDILNTVGGARSGNNFATFSPATNQNARLTSPTTTALLASTKYTVQYYAKSTLNPTTILGGALYSNATTINVSATPTTSIWTADTWFKVSVTITATATTPTFAAVRFSANNATLGLGDLSVDDFVVYAGDADVTAPEAPSAATVSGSSISWTAPGTGVDGGGYIVVRYATNPNADNDPNQNGIYAVGNTITNGTGSLVGTVAYVGTATSFTDTAAGTYYKVYTVDKAFNYSAEGGTLGTAKFNTNKVSLYPNPASREFKVTSVHNIDKITIFNTLGQKMLESRPNKVEASVDVSSFANGLYLIQVDADGNSMTQKLMKN
ncbi:T9SS type A sorting domain-containing protein [Flavobacterium nackdongense]|uniref:T9SS type A sorting domain-containing protein n=1 Tax=Flavobacterium nackdongense TaxID=2547394 RepID=A0A4P6YHR0_9FLAO|nr:T9SS type A sorting domain-containing protein [Flavobacterium nackdongense]QBN20405.1 T9SS type A sorting domain-containing protein [Flavobacterium nackdongense]